MVMDQNVNIVASIFEQEVFIQYFFIAGQFSLINYHFRLSSNILGSIGHKLKRQSSTLLIVVLHLPAAAAGREPKMRHDQRRKLLP